MRLKKTRHTYYSRECKYSLLTPIDRISCYEKKILSVMGLVEQSSIKLLSVELEAKCRVSSYAIQVASYVLRDASYKL